MAKREPIAVYRSEKPIELPDLCARCGNETTHRIRVRARKESDPLPFVLRALLVISGIHLLYILFCNFSFRSVKIPSCARCHLFLYAANLSLVFFALVVPAGCFYLIIKPSVALYWQAQLGLSVLMLVSLFSAPAIFTRLKLSAAPVEVYRYQGELIYCFYTDVYENARTRPRQYTGVPKGFQFPMR